MRPVDCTPLRHRMCLYQSWRHSCTHESAEDLPLKVLEMEINGKYERGQRIFVIRRGVYYFKLKR